MEQGHKKIERIERATTDLAEEFRDIVNEEGHVDFSVRPGDSREPASLDYQKKQIVGLFDELMGREDLSEEDREDLTYRFDEAKGYLGVESE